MRLFVAVAVPEQVAGELEAAVAPLRSSWPSLRWTGIDAWHLTLAFLGEVNDVIAAGLADPLRIAAAEHAPLTLSLAGSGAFPGAGRAHVLWTGVHRRVHGDAQLVAAELAVGLGVHDPVDAQDRRHGGGIDRIREVDRAHDL